MSRFILRFRGAGPAAEGEIQRIKAVNRLTVIDASSPRMLLVEAPREELEKLLAELPGWQMAEEKGIPLPDTRLKVEKPPGDNEGG